VASEGRVESVKSVEYAKFAAEKEYTPPSFFKDIS
jgi:hypothetical protein